MSLPQASPPGTARVDLAPWLFHGLPTPVCLLDAAGRLLALNPSAMAFCGPGAEALLGLPAMEALALVPADGHGDAWSRLTPTGARPRLACRVTAADGGSRPVDVIYTALSGGDEPLAVLFLIGPEVAEALSTTPEWALRDPVTGLGNRQRWEREVAHWDQRPGCVAFFDLDDLKEVNDLHGHVAGDRTLAAVGAALGTFAPADSLTVRYGGDEFVVLHPSADEAAVGAWARNAVAHVARVAASAELPIVPRLSHGEAAFGPGGLRLAVQRADDLLYERKGVLLRAAGGGRLILTREGRTALRGPGDDRRPLAARVNRFGPEFEAHFRSIYARSLEQAREFVAFVQPESGQAVVEVGAGAGRITFDGGLAARVGEAGQLLVTDPSGDQLVEARRRAAALGLPWLHFLRAPAEELPLASGTADLVIGSTFLHLADPERALREMVRVIRPGGRVALSAPLEPPLSPMLRSCLEPVWAVLAEYGREPRSFLLSEADLRTAFAQAGLEVERSQLTGLEELSVPSVEVAVAMCEQAGLVSVLLRDVPAERHPAAQAAFAARLREEFPPTPPEARRRHMRWLHLVGRRVQ